MKKEHSSVFKIIGASLVIAGFIFLSPQQFSGTYTLELFSTNQAQAATCGVTYYGPTTFPAGCYECNNGWTGCISSDTYGGASGVNCVLSSSCTPPPPPDYACTVQSGTFTYPYTYPASTLPSGTYDIITSTIPPYSFSQTYGSPGLSQGAYVLVPGFYSGSRNGGGCSWDVTILPPPLSWYGTPNGTVLSSSQDYVFDLKANSAINAIWYLNNKWGDDRFYSSVTEIPANAAADIMVGSDMAVGTYGIGVFDCQNGASGCLGNIQWSSPGREWAGVSLGTPPIINIPFGTYYRDIYMRDTNGVWSAPFNNTFTIKPVCTVPPMGATVSAPYSFSFNIMDGNYWGSNAGVSYSSVYLKADGTPRYPGELTDTIKNSFNQPFGAGNYVGNLNNAGTNSLCRWDFTVPNTYTHYSYSAWGACSGYNQYTGEGGTQTRTVTSSTNTTPPSDVMEPLSQSCSVGSYTHYTANNNPWSACTGYDVNGQNGTQTRAQAVPLTYTNTTGPNDSSAPPLSQSCSVTLYTHYTTNNNPWSACIGYNMTTGQNGTQTRAQAVPLTYTNTTSPNDSSAPPLSQSCSMPPDFNFIPNNSYSTFATFVGGQQSALSAPVTIAVSPVFANYPSPPNLTFAVTNVSPALPSGVSYTFTPNPLSSSQYSQGASFVINVPATNAVLYTLTVEASGGGIIKQATVYLNVNEVNPTFIEI